MITAAYIPARLGSQRIKHKNLRHINGQPLVSYVIRTALKAKHIDKLYLNTESEEISNIGINIGIEIYRRNPKLCSDSTTTDEILYDFANSVQCDRILVINPTAPFLNTSTIEKFIQNHDDIEKTLFSTTLMKKHLVYEAQPVNFSVSNRSPRTQDLEPFDVINFVMFLISRQKVINNYEANGFCLYIGKLSYFRMDGLECHDIDTEDDLRLAEALANMQDSPQISRLII